LILIGHIDVLPAWFDKVILPVTVRDQLCHPKAPAAVRNWILEPPHWADVRPAPPGHDPALNALDAGETSAILLAMQLHADLVLMDDAEGVAAAPTKGLEVVGTLGVLHFSSHGSTKKLISLPFNSLTQISRKT
jgi:predicted nucleic acid-binding protein